LAEGKGKQVKRLSTYIAPQAASVQLCATDRAGVQPRPQSKLAHTDFGLQLYLALVCSF